MEYYPQNAPNRQPFRFQTLQQKRLYGKLQLLGPGPATFYREACMLLTPPQQFESATHLVAHLLREIESAVRRVLLPYNYSPQDSCPTCHNQSEGHAKQIEAIAQSLGLDENLQKAWKEIATRNNEFNGLAALAHREDLSLPRGIDSYFLALVNTFEVVFDSVLTTFERQSIDVFALLDRLLLKELPSKTKKDLSVLKNKIPHNDATHRYFFERLQSPGWLDPLHQAGFFLPLPPRGWNEEVGLPVFSPWPCTPYLHRIAHHESAQRTVLNILQEVAETDNPFVRYDILEIVQILPASLAATVVPVIQKWMDDSIPRTVDFTQISNIITHLIQGNENASALALLESCLTALAPKESISERWEYEELLTKHLSSLVKCSAIEILALLCNLLEAEVYVYYIRFRNVQDDKTNRLQKEAQEASTTSWQHAIGAAQSGISRGMFAPLNLLVVSLEKAAEQAIQQQSLSLETMVELFELHHGRIFQRLTLAVLSHFSQDAPELVKHFLLNRVLFDDTDARHEYGLLVHAGFSLLSSEEQEMLLRWIDAGPDLQRYREWYSQVGQAMPSDELVQAYANVWRRDWLERIGDGLPIAWKARRVALVAEYGPFESEDVGLRFATWVGPTSSLSVDELRSMTIEQLLIFLKTWQPSGEMMNPSREGLGRLLTTIVGEDPERFAKHAHQFQENNPIYIHAVVQGFTDAMRNHRHFEWERVLDLCQWVVNQRYSGAEDGTVTTLAAEWAWICQEIAYLLQYATEAQPSILPITLRAALWSILEPLADDPDLVQDDEVDTNESGKDDRVNTYVTRAINSIRGNALHTVIAYAWWVRNQVKQEENTENSLGMEAMPEVRAVLERHIDPDRDDSLAVRSVFGQRLPFLVALDAHWTAAHLTYLFPHAIHQQALRTVTWNTYVVFCQPSNPVFKLLQEEYANAIERLDVPKQSESIVDDPDYHLGEHLIRLYWSGQLPLASPESLLTRYFTKASDELREHVLAFVGLALYNTGENTPPEIVERVQRLWEWRLSEAQSARNTSQYTQELAAFGQWFRSDICPVEWGMRQLESVLILTGNIDMSYAVVERLARLVSYHPKLTVRCLDLLVKGNLMMWTTSTWEKSVQPVLVYALQQEEKETQQQVRAIISYLALNYGMTRFLELLNSND